MRARHQKKATEAEERKKSGTECNLKRRQGKMLRKKAARKR